MDRQLDIANMVVDKLHPGGGIVYFAEFADGCTTIGIVDADGKYHENYNGKNHAPHLAFCPDDVPIREEGVRRI